MKKKIAALILTIVMACSFCMTSCVIDAVTYPLAAKKMGVKVQPILIVKNLLTPFDTFTYIKDLQK